MPEHISCPTATKVSLAANWLMLASLADAVQLCISYCFCRCLRSVFTSCSFILTRFLLTPTDHMKGLKGPLIKRKLQFRCRPLLLLLINISDKQHCLPVSSTCLLQRDTFYYDVIMYLCCYTDSLWHTLP